MRAPATTESAKIYFKAYWHVLFPHESHVAHNDSMKDNHDNAGTLECGLQQVFGDNAANVDLYANIEFEGRESFSADSNALQFLIEKFKISCACCDQDIYWMLRGFARVFSTQPLFNNQFLL